MTEARSSFRIEFGVREVDITPPLGIHLHNWSAAELHVATGVHRPLLGKLLALATGSSRALLVSLDLGWWMTADDESQLRHSLLEATALPTSALIFCLTHTHSGPSLSRADADEPGGHLIAAWLDRVAVDLAEAAVEVLLSVEPGVLDFEIGGCTLAANRDLPLADGSVACGFNPSAPALDRLLVGRISDQAGIARVAITQYAAHPTSLGPDNTLISPDYVGAARELVETTAGVSFVFVQGPSGELAPREQYSGDVATADRNGRVLGHATLAVLERMAPAGTRVVFDRVLQSGAPLALTRLQASDVDSSLTTSTINVQLPAQDNRPPIAAELSPGVAADRLTRARRISGGSPQHVVDLDVTIWRIGDLVLIAHPGEAYSDLQTLLQSHFPDLTIAIINLANGSHQGYIAPAAAYEDHRYQSWQSPLAADAFDCLLSALIAAVERSSESPATPTPPTAKDQS